MNRHTRVRQGIGLILLGCLTWLFIFILVMDTYAKGIFSTINTHAPNTPFESFNCPLFMNLGESAPLNVTLLTPAGDPGSYSISIEAPGFEIKPLLLNYYFQVPAGHSTDFAWRITPRQAGKLTLVVRAYSEKDGASSSGPYNAWITSFGQACGVFVFPVPWGGQGIILLGFICVLAGFGGLFPGLFARLRIRG